MKKISYILILSLILLIIPTGCTKEYTKSDIEQYVAETYSGIITDPFTVSEKPLEVEGEDKYTDKLWTVTVKGKNKITFHIIDDFHWGMESLTNSLRSDYHDIATELLYNEYKGETGFNLNKEEVEGGFTDVRLTADFKTLDELQGLIENCKKFTSYIKSSAYKPDAKLYFQFDNPLRNKVQGGYSVDDGDYPCYSSKITDKTYENIKNRYLLCCLDYRFEDLLAQFTEEDIKKALNNDDDFDRIALSDDGTEDGNLTIYPDLCASRFSYGISFGTLYEILCRENYDVTGNSWHYTFDDGNGNKYEISYDFCDYDFGESKIGYCYIKNGEKNSYGRIFLQSFYRKTGG